MFSDFLRQRLPSSRLPDKEMLNLYERYAPQRYDLADLGYLARIHPLELWLVTYLRRHPEASLAQTIEASAAERQAVYAWLFRTHQKNAQDIAGAAAIPQDLKNSARMLGLSRAEQWRTLTLPALFPYIITGAITASGGASAIRSNLSWRRTQRRSASPATGRRLWQS